MILTCTAAPVNTGQNGLLAFAWCSTAPIDPSDYFISHDLFFTVEWDELSTWEASICPYMPFLGYHYCHDCNSWRMHTRAHLSQSIRLHAWDHLIWLWFSTKYYIPSGLGGPVAQSVERENYTRC